VVELTTGMAAGDGDAYRTFYDHYFHRLLRYLLVLSGGEEETARECLQLTMLRVARHARPFDTEAAFWSWLTVLARSSWVDEHRRRQRHWHLLERFFRGRVQAPEADESASDNRLLSLLEAHLVQLPPDERELVERKYLEDTPVAELALALGCSEKAVDSRLVRIRRKLKHAILTRLKHEESI
jgi:RNA polymerase sigma-70 factor, ECF subfamily